MIEKSHNVTVGAVLHNLHALCAGYEGVIAGENFQCRAADAAVTVKAAAALISQLPCWIPVAERLPQQYEIVMVGWAGRRDIGEGYLHNGKWHDPLVCQPDVNQPTHWMPLPAPPAQ